MNRVRHSAIFNSSSLDILLIGAGGIGSMAALALSKMGLNSLTIYDGDVVSEENTGTQLYSTYDLGKKKVFGLKNTLYHLVDDVPLITRHVNFDAYIAKVMGEEGAGYDVIVSAVDSLEARQEIWKGIQGITWMYYIDARMASEAYSHYVIYHPDPGSFLRYDRFVLSVSDEEVADEPCVSKATYYTACIAAGHIGRAVRMIATGNVPDYYLYHDIKGERLICGK